MKHYINQPILYVLFYKGVKIKFNLLYKDIEYKAGNEDVGEETDKGFKV